MQCNDDILYTSSRHDFHQSHGGRNGECDGKGLMSYGNPPDQWSKCSNSDFKTYWRKEGFTCMKETVNNGGGRNFEIVVSPSLTNST